MSNRRYTLFDLKNIPTENFLMIPLELKDYVKFTPKRIYFISDPAGEKKTGSHCHLREEDELFVMVSGSCTIVVDDGHGLEEIKLEGPKKAIFIPAKVWHHFKDMTDDAIVCAISSTNYNSERSDYCEDYNEFKKLVPNEG
ncbi:FdtA/QdtA family cupin domain-containing protein [Patescibacteria group bacterium]